MYLNISRKDITSDLLLDFINQDMESDFKQTMFIADKYNKVENIKISNRKKMMTMSDKDGEIYLANDLSKANNKIKHSYLNELINQCTNYLAGKPLRIDYKKAFERAWNEDGIVTNDEALQSNKYKELIDDELYHHNNFVSYIQDVIDNVQLYGVAYMRIVRDEHGNKFINYDPKEIIMFYNDYDEPILTIRYFSKNEIEDGEIVSIDYVEVFDEKYKDTWKKESEKYTKIIEDEAVFAEHISYGDEIIVHVKEYGLYPIIEWRFNKDKTPTITNIIDFIDLQDLNISDLANNVDDIQDAIWILENYHGQDIREFMHDLKVKKAVKVGVGGGVRSETIEIPIEARSKLYELTTKNIYKFGFGIDFSERNALGNVTGVALKWSYAPLEQKANAIENNGQNALNQFFNILFELLDLPYDSNDLEFIFDRTMIANEQEQTQTVMSASSQLSQKTILDNLPMVKDTEDELERLNDETDYYPTLPTEFIGSGDTYSSEVDDEDEAVDELDNIGDYVQ